MATVSERNSVRGLELGYLLWRTERQKMLNLSEDDIEQVAVFQDGVVWVTLALHAFKAMFRGCVVDSEGNERRAIRNGVTYKAWDFSESHYDEVQL